MGQSRWVDSPYFGLAKLKGNFEHVVLLHLVVVCRINMVKLCLISQAFSIPCGGLIGIPNNKFDNEKICKGSEMYSHSLMHKATFGMA